MNRATKDQIAAIMLQHGTPTQQEDALKYCGISTGEHVDKRDATIDKLQADEERSLCVWHELRTKLVAAGCDPYALMPEMVDALIAKVAEQDAQIEVAKENLVEAAIDWSSNGKYQVKGKLDAAIGILDDPSAALAKVKADTLRDAAVRVKAMDYYSAANILHFMADEIEGAMK